MRSATAAMTARRRPRRRRSPVEAQSMSRDRLRERRAYPRGIGREPEAAAEADPLTPCIGDADQARERHEEHEAGQRGAARRRHDPGARETTEAAPFGAPFSPAMRGVISLGIITARGLGKYRTGDWGLGIGD